MSLDKNYSIFLSWQLLKNFVQYFKGSTRRFGSEGVYSWASERALQAGLLQCIEHAPANIINKGEALILNSGKNFCN